MLMKRPRKSNLCWDYSLSGAKMDWRKHVGAMSHILTLQGTGRIGWALKNIFLLRTCPRIPASVILHREGWHAQNPNLNIQLKRALSQLGRLAQNQVLFVFFARKRSHFSTWQKDVDSSCWCLGLLWLQLSHSREQQRWPECLSICFSSAFQGGSACSITLMSVSSPVYLHSAVLLPHQ